MNSEILSNSRILSVLEDFDPATALHCKRVSILSKSIGKGFGLPKEDLSQLAFSGLLHDIGKIAVPKSLVLKPDPLSAAEYVVLKSHVDSGAVIAEAADYGETVINVIRRHHERLDGSGYPLGLAGDQIDIFSRIVAVADVYSAMTSDHPYREASTVEAAILELTNTRKYDIKVVNLLEQLLASPSEKM